MLKGDGFFVFKERLQTFLFIIFVDFGLETLSWTLGKDFSLNILSWTGWTSWKKVV